METFNQIAQELSIWALNNLHKLIMDIPNQEDLLSDSIRYEGVDKLVLWNSKDKNMQIRLHIYSGCLKSNQDQIDIGKAHNHRWNFAARILAGGYRHTIYRPDPFTPVLIRYESVGSGYTLHHSQYHAIVEEPGTMSLIVRGPIEKESFQVICEGEDGIVLKNAPRCASRNVMTWSDYQAVVYRLRALELM